MDLRELLRFLTAVVSRDLELILFIDPREAP
jgi:hypothetical protein